MMVLHAVDLVQKIRNLLQSLSENATARSGLAVLQGVFNYIALTLLCTLCQVTNLIRINLMILLSWADVSSLGQCAAKANNQLC